MWLLTLGLEGWDHWSFLPSKMLIYNKSAAKLLVSNIISCGLQNRLEDGNVDYQLRDDYQEACV